MSYKRIIACIICILVVLVVIPIDNQNVEASTDRDKRACWVSYQDIYDELRDKNETEFKAALSIIYDNIIKNNMNTVIMHVRAMGDATYPSDFYPWSTYITSDRTDPGYDPLEIMVDLAHSKGLKFEAWINPYRISLSDTTTDSFKATSYYSNYKEHIIEFENSGGQICMVLDPSKQEARDLISKGVVEIVSNYDVDAIHFDDYFYVDGMTVDLSQEAKMANVNMLIKQVYGEIKSIDKDCGFGISPAGNLDNARAQGADIDTWLSEEGYIDYIMPQIYWSDVYHTGVGVQTMYSDRCRSWQSINIRDIPIYVGLALYRVGEDNEYDKGWHLSNNNLAKQCELAYSMGYDGYSLFRYEWLNKSIANDELTNLNNYIGLSDLDYSEKTVPNHRKNIMLLTAHFQTYQLSCLEEKFEYAVTSEKYKRLDRILLKFEIKE